MRSMCAANNLDASFEVGVLRPVSKPRAITLPNELPRRAE
jgi:hypothetical protein